jgi:hypothetical protein
MVWVVFGAALGCVGMVGCANEVESMGCVAEDLPDLEITIAPVTEQGDISFTGPCTVVTATDTPLSLELACGASPPITLDVSGVSNASWSAELPAGTAVDVRYAMIAHISRAPAWLTVRRSGESEPTIVAVRSWQPTPWIEGADDFMSPLELAFVGETDCVETRGSCNNGPRRRGAVRASVSGDETIVFDHNEDEVAGYRVIVGEAEVDHGECEGLNATWYEVLVTRPSG